MNKRGKVVVLCIALFCALTSPANAKSDDDRNDFISKKPMNLEELYSAMDYNEGINKAINLFEKKFNTKVKLPETMPFKVNLSFGKVQEEIVN
ncbi:hypothetical protein [Oceanobacillus manasiensis]|uniref:hypothetical protein n=1 Tax=Oceanobacillus manasiensis TaxID=586413 RepID=UPI0005A6388F|nr:hypothetical protein [Oceanobacillus manasiensis]